MVFGEDSGLDGDDLLKQRDGGCYFPVGLVGAGERVLRREPLGVVFIEIGFPPLLCLF